jgi:methionine--tRNA ligase beta chain
LRVLQVGAMATLTIDDFKRVDLRVGTVLAASPHPRADRLLVLEVDLGDERRQLVAGIRAHYAAEDLVGKQVIVVANLTSATLRGGESQGMVLAASDSEGRLTLIGPQQPITPGATVR